MLERIAVAVMVAAAMFVAGDWHGAGRVNAEWDIETAKRVEEAKIAEETNKGAIEREKLEREKVLATAKSQAGRDAVRDYIRKLGLLPNRPAVQPAQPSAENQSPGGTDAAPAECVAGGNPESIEEFAMSCALDAAHVIRWQQFILSNPQAFEIME